MGRVCSPVSLFSWHRRPLLSKNSTSNTLHCGNSTHLMTAWGPTKPDHRAQSVQIYAMPRNVVQCHKRSLADWLWLLPTERRAAVEKGSNRDFQTNRAPGFSGSNSKLLTKSALHLGQSLLTRDLVTSTIIMAFVCTGCGAADSVLVQAGGERRRRNSNAGRGS